MEWLARQWAALVERTWRAVRIWTTPTANPMRLGQWGELQAVRFLRSRGYRIVECNVRTPFGELDVVAWDGQSAVFVEVKARRATASQNQQPLEVSVEQARRIARAAHWYRRRHRLMAYPARFELCAVFVKNGTPHVEILAHPWEDLQDCDWLDT